MLPRGRSLVSDEGWPAPTPGPVRAERSPAVMSQETQQELEVLAERLARLRGYL
jgi:hypothetical protein